MALTVHILENRQENVDLRNPSAVLNVIALRSRDEDAVRAAINLATPAYYKGLSKLNIIPNEEGGGVWTATVNYGMMNAEGTVTVPGQAGASPPPAAPSNPAENDELDESYTFNTTGFTEHITQARNPWFNENQIVPIGYPNGVNADEEEERIIPRPGVVGPHPKPTGIIGLDESGNATGVDIESGILEFTVTRTFPTISLKYVRLLKALTGCVNSGFFFTHKEGELKFKGASGQKQGPAGWPVTFHFAQSETLTNIIVWEDPAARFDFSKPEDDAVNVLAKSKALIVPRKRGWDYLWVEYETVADGGRLTKRPRYAHIEQTHRYANFDLLGLGMDPY